MDEFRISVVIACYNASSTLHFQLEALAGQSYAEPFEVLVCDNGSTDDSRAIAEGFTGQLPHLRVLDASDVRGPGHARNVGAWASRSPLLAFCDADDVVAPDWVATMVTSLEDHQMVAGRFEAKRLNDPAALRSRQLQQGSELQSSPFGPDLPHAGAGNLGVHRDVFLTVQGFDPAVGCLEDSDLCWRIQLTGVELVFELAAVVHVRLRSSWRGMWSQGVTYGEASAALEHRFIRYGAAADASRPYRSLVRRVLGLVRGEPSVGRLLWQVGWFVGHRRWQPGDAVPLPTPDLYP